MNTYLALLRGINVGGNNRIKMADLRACFEEQGFADVRTYIQSGNVIFAADGPDQATLIRQIENALSATFGLELPVALRSHDELKAIVARAPERFGGDPETYRYDFIFLKAPLTAAEAMEYVQVKEGVDEVVAGEGVLYFSRLIARASQSRMSRIVGTPVYQNMTIRNWNTTTRLLAMMDGE